MTDANDAVNESLSALLDNEHNEMDLRRILKAAETDPAVSEKWANYQLARLAIKKDVDAVCAPSFLEGIRIAIEDEVMVEQDSRYGQWQRYTSKFAIAACVTFAFLIGVNQWNLGSVEGQQSIEVADTSSQTESMAVVPSGFELPPLNARTVSGGAPVSSIPAYASIPMRASKSAASRAEVVLSPELQAQLQRMMLKHTENSSANGGLSVMPFTRVGSVKNEQE